MIDKSLVKKRFKKSLDTYDDNAIVQKQTAKKLIELLPKKQYSSVFEIGCATGILTKEIYERIIFEEFYANDIVEESGDFVKKIISNTKFIQGDIEEIIFDKKYDLIISNACLQWCNDIENTIDKLVKALNKDGILAVSIFGDDNLKEITKLFGINNKTYSLAELKEKIAKYNVVKYQEEIINLSFESPLEILKHLKLTGVNAVQTMHLTKSKLKAFEQKYITQFFQNGKVILTYNPVYIVIKL